MAVAAPDKQKIIAEGTALYEAAKQALLAYMATLDIMKASNVRLGTLRKKAIALLASNPAKGKLEVKKYAAQVKKEQAKFDRAKRKAVDDAGVVSGKLAAFVKKHKQQLTAAPKLQKLAADLEIAKNGLKILDKLRAKMDAERKKTTKKSSKKTTKKSSKKTTSR